MLTKPDWTRQLDPSKAYELFPEKAAAASLTTGRATVDCVVGPKGRLTQCRASSEQPAGMDFGRAAEAIASALSVSAWTMEGRPAEGAHVRFAVRVNQSEPTEAAAK